MAGTETDEIPFIPECEVLYQGGDAEKCKALFDNCVKNPGHKGFIPVKEFGIKHFPKGGGNRMTSGNARLQHKEIMEGIHLRCDLTVKVIVSSTSPHRPDVYPGTVAPYPYSHLKGVDGISRCGTGYILIDSPYFKIEGRPCPCLPCRKSDSPEMTYWKFRLGTATHVIFDELEAVSSIFECFYDSEDREGVEFLYGFNVSREDDPIRRTNTDLSIVTVVTHNEGLARRLEVICQRIVSFPFVREGFQNMEAVIISHPHGCSKHISLGKVVHFTLPMNSKFDVDKSYSLEQIPHLRHLFDGLNINNDPVTSSLMKALRRKVKELYRFTPKTTFTLPSTASYIYRYPYPLSDLAVSFPPGTSFKPPLSSSEMVTPRPSALVYWRPDDSIDKSFDCLQYITYNTSTCPGTSGAAIHLCDEKDRNSHILHCGALKEGSNRSGLSKLYTSVKSIKMIANSRKRKLVLLDDNEEVPTTSF